MLGSSAGPIGESRRRDLLVISPEVDPPGLPAPEGVSCSFEQRLGATPVRPPRPSVPRSTLVPLRRRAASIAENLAGFPHEGHVGTRAVDEGHPCLENRALSSHCRVTTQAPFVITRSRVMLQVSLGNTLSAVSRNFGLISWLQRPTFPLEQCRSRPRFARAPFSSRRHRVSPLARRRVAR
jgi:hypothetical protein